MCTLQEESEWQTVGAPRRGSSGGKGDSFAADRNPLLHATGYVYRGYTHDNERNPGGQYERDIFRGGSGGLGTGMMHYPGMDADEGPGFPGRRGLPTRQDDLF